MSYYTNIYPNPEKFSWAAYKTKEELQEQIESAERKVNTVWEGIVALCAAEPKSITPDGDQPIDYITRMLTLYWQSLIDKIENLYHLETLKTLWEDKEYDEKHYPEGEHKLTLWWNKFPYNHNPQEGIDDCNDNLKYLKNKLLLFAFGSPKELFSGKDEEGYPVHPVDKLYTELKECEEEITDNVTTLAFCKLCVEYWDTHTEG